MDCQVKSVERCALVKPRCSPLSAAYFSPLIHSSAEYNVPAEESRRNDDIANQVKVCWGKRRVAGGSWRGSETRRAESVEFCRLCFHEAAAIASAGEC